MTAYEKTLAALWRKHLAPRQPNAPTVVSLFSGAGGSSLGYSAAGFREVLAVEHDETAVETFRLNFPGVPVWADDIARLSVEKALAIAQLKRGELDLLDFSPPCVADSSAGEQKLSDPRGWLWKEGVRLLDELQPKHFIMEAVPGLLHRKLRPKFDEMQAAFRKSGYRFESKILNAADYGVPQDRRRLIFHGVRQDLNIEPLLPKPDAGGKVRTVTDAWAGLPEIQSRVTPTGTLATFVSRIEPGRDGRYTNPGRSYFSTRRLHWERPANTVCAQVFACGGLFLHPDLDKGISVVEVARLQSFPDEFKVVGTKWSQRWKQLGNAVPPLLALAIGDVVAGTAQTRASTVDESFCRRDGCLMSPPIDRTSRIITGDCIREMAPLEDNSIDACITSPPYAQQRKAQYGGVPEAEYPAWTVNWMRALRPKLKADGSVLMVIRPHIKNGQISDYVLRTRLALRADGWNECEELIWLKADAPPLGSTLRPRRAHESILWFSKTRNPFVNLKACGSESQRTGGFFGSMRHGNGSGIPVHGGQRRTPKQGISRVRDVFAANVGCIDRGIMHPAMYPRSLTNQLVKTFSRPGSIILDLFAGSGTTCLSAVDCGRIAIGIERDPKYASLARERLCAGLGEGEKVIDVSGVPSRKRLAAAQAEGAGESDAASVPGKRIQDGSLDPSITRPPYAELPDNRLMGNAVLQQDCLSYLSSCPKEVFDLVIADPPYYRIHGEFDFIWKTPEEYLEWSRQWVREVARTLKPNGSFYLWGAIGYGKGYPLPRLAYWIEDEGLFKVQDFITQRNCRGFGTKRGFMAAREELIRMTRSDDYTWNPVYTEEKSNRKDLGANGKPRKNVYKRCTDVWIDIAEASQSSKERFRLADGTLFPTVKPLKACKRIIEASSHKGDLIYIPFGGSGSEAVAAQSLERRFVVTEIDPDHIQSIQNRLVGNDNALLGVQKAGSKCGCENVGNEVEALAA